jgi:transposase
MKKSRRNFSSAFKAEVAMETIKGIKTVAEIAQEYEIHPLQVSSWKKALMEKAADVFEGEKKKDEELDKLRNEREELFKQLGELKFENNWYKKNSNDERRTTM